MNTLKITARTQAKLKPVPTNRGAQYVPSKGQRQLLNEAIKSVNQARNKLGEYTRWSNAIEKLENNGQWGLPGYAAARLGKANRADHLRWRNELNDKTNYAGKADKF